MTMKKKKPAFRMPNLRGPNGNAFALVDLARKAGKQAGWTPEHLEHVTDDMMASDYEHLLNVIRRHFKVTNDNR